VSTNSVYSHLPPQKEKVPTELYILKCKPFIKLGNTTAILPSYESKTRSAVTTEIVTERDNTLQKPKEIQGDQKVSGHLNSIL